MTPFSLPALPLDSAARRALRARAHALDPVVMVSSAGLSEAVVGELDRALAHHGLIKVRVFGEERAERDELLAAICERLGAAAVQHIGKILVVYRPPAQKAEEPLAPKKQATRKTTVAATKRPARAAEAPARGPRDKPPARPKRIMGTAKRSPARARRRRLS